MRRLHRMLNSVSEYLCSAGSMVYLELQWCRNDVCSMSKGNDAPRHPHFCFTFKSSDNYIRCDLNLRVFFLQFWNTINTIRSLAGWLTGWLASGRIAFSTKMINDIALIYFHLNSTTPTTIQTLCACQNVKRQTNRNHLTWTTRTQKIFWNEKNCCVTPNRLAILYMRERSISNLCHFSAWYLYPNLKL